MCPFGLCVGNTGSPRSDRSAWAAAFRGATAQFTIAAPTQPKKRCKKGKKLKKGKCVKKKRKKKK
ncbi:MAG: hypothetical protein FJW90_12165 [Actinobacteria bacterium]|nr:hypothetical protein [Actinomycetota bacterium]